MAAATDVLSRDALPGQKARLTGVFDMAAADDVLNRGVRSVQ